MTKELKEEIDAIWLESDYGMLLKAISNDDNEQSEKTWQKIFNNGYLTIEMLENELSKKIINVLDTSSQVEEYLSLLEKEENDLLDVVIKYDLFSKVEKMLNVINNKELNY